MIASDPAVLENSPPDAGRIDVVGIGNALVDVLSHESEEFLARHNLIKGTMALIDKEQADVLYDEMAVAVEISGGSAANTMVGISSLGGSAAFIGRVHDDQLGAIFAHDLRASGIKVSTTPAAQGPPTGRCLILVTPDAERTLNTFLGAAADIDETDVTSELIEQAQITYLEGYLYDQPKAKRAFHEAARIAHNAGRKVALTLSDPFCVDRHRDDFLKLVEDSIDILFANESEICSLYQVSEFDEALARVRGHCEIGVLTRGENGAVIVAGSDVHAVPAHPVPTGIVDSTGAGDLYAAGFLFGLSRDYSLYRCASIAAIAAAEVISHIGARPEADLAALANSVS